MKFILLVVIGCISAVQGVNWNGNNWALNCDFYGKDLTSARISGAECGGRCANTNGCTHWTWTNYNGGTCWMKQGDVCKDEARDKDGGVCGYQKSSCGGSGGGGGDDIQPVVGGSAVQSFTGCQFRFGAFWDGENVNYNSFDYIHHWLGEVAQGCSHQDRCTDFNEYWAGAAVKKAKDLGKKAAFYTYIIAFEARNQWGLQDCNMPGQNLCEKGANFIRQFRNRLIERYEHYAQNVARIYGGNNPAVYMIEPDFVQYYNDHRQQGGTLSGSEMRKLFDDFVRAIKKHHPAALISWDISPWLSENDMRTYWNFFKDADIQFLHTSGGGALADSAQIHHNERTWRFMKDLTGKPMFADTGYGVGGAGDVASTYPWYNQGNVNNKASEGVIGVSIAKRRDSPGFHKTIC